MAKSTDKKIIANNQAILKILSISILISLIISVSFSVLFNNFYDTAIKWTWILILAVVEFTSLILLSRAARSQYSLNGRDIVQTGMDLDNAQFPYELILDLLYMTILVQALLPFNLQISLFGLGTLSPWSLYWILPIIFGLKAVVYVRSMYNMFRGMMPQTSQAGNDSQQKASTEARNSGTQQPNATDAAVKSKRSIKMEARQKKYGSPALKRT